MTSVPTSIIALVGGERYQVVGMDFRSLRMLWAKARAGDQSTFALPTEDDPEIVVSAQHITFITKGQDQELHT